MLNELQTQDNKHRLLTQHHYGEQNLRGSRSPDRESITMKDDTKMKRIPTHPGLIPKEEIKVRRLSANRLSLSLAGC